MRIVFLTLAIMFFSTQLAHTVVPTSFQRQGTSFQRQGAVSWIDVKTASCAPIFQFSKILLFTELWNSHQHWWAKQWRNDLKQQFSTLRKQGNRRNLPILWMKSSYLVSTARLVLDYGARRFSKSWDWLGRSGLSDWSRTIHMVLLELQRLQRWTTSGISRGRSHNLGGE